MDPMLLSLRRADIVLALASRIEGPAGLRISFSEAKSRGELPGELIEEAVACARAVGAIHDEVTRQVVQLSMAMHNGRARYPIRLIAVMLGLSAPKVQRLLTAGLNEVSRALTPRINASGELEAA